MTVYFFIEILWFFTSIGIEPKTGKYRRGIVDVQSKHSKG